MVKTRLTNLDAIQFKGNYDGMIGRFGASFSRERDTITKDSLGNITGTTKAATTVSGDFQLIVDVKELSKLGLTGTGNAKFYGKSEDTFQPDDILVVDSERWTFRKRIEDDKFGNEGVCNTWLLVRIDG